MVEYAARRGTLPVPPHVVWDDLAAPQLTGTRAWLELQDGETEPEMLEGDRPSRLVWTSLWDDRPDDRVEFTLTSRGSDTLVAVVVVADQDTEPDQASQIRRRLGQLVFDELRLSYGG
jgi:hypothetical protein